MHGTGTGNCRTTKSATADEKKTGKSWTSAETNQYPSKGGGVRTYRIDDLNGKENLKENKKTRKVKTGLERILGNGVGKKVGSIGQTLVQRTSAG